ncbi:hypothetical protein ACOSQ4_017169 [Xanthoceras sorbifolium]
MFTSLELLHHIPTQPRAPPAKQQPSEEKTAEDRDSINHEMKLPTVSVKDLPPPLPQATEEPYTNLKHQKTRELKDAQKKQIEGARKKQIEDAREYTDREQDSRSKTAQKNRTQPMNKKDETKLLGARSNNSKTMAASYRRQKKKGPRNQ